MKNVNILHINIWHTKGMIVIDSCEKFYLDGIGEWHFATPWYVWQAKTN